MAPLESQSLTEFFPCHSIMRDQKMKNIKKMGSILIANFYSQTYLYIFIFIRRLYVQSMDFVFKS